MPSYPVGIVRVLAPDEEGSLSVRDTLFLHDLAGPYQFLGLSNDRMEQWQLDYGVDSLGKSPDGGMLLPAFPIFSKVAWMHVDPVIVAGPELPQLIRECAKAEILAAERPECSAFTEIRSMAERAIELRGCLEFGHP